MVRLVPERSEIQVKSPPGRILFKAEKVVVTPGIVDLCVPMGTLEDLVTRHYKGEWGACDPEDIRENELALAEKNLRLWSVFIMPRTKTLVWVITEADRSATTILLPDEY